MKFALHCLPSWLQFCHILDELRSGANAGKMWVPLERAVAEFVALIGIDWGDKKHAWALQAGDSTKIEKEPSPLSPHRHVCSRAQSGPLRLRLRENHEAPESLSNPTAVVPPTEPGCSPPFP